MTEETSQVKKPPLKIALLGSAPSSIRIAPYADPRWQMWGCSPGAWASISLGGHDPAARIAVWWELHRYEPGQPWFSPEYCQFLARHPKVMMAERRPEVPNSERVPTEELVAKYGPYFFTSSLSYMFACAIEAIEAYGIEGSAIGLWGVDMAATEEYGYQRAGCQYFAMLARAKGIEVGVPSESDLFRPPPLYGVSEIDHARIKFLARRRELEERIRAAQAAEARAHDERLFVQGALDDLTWVENTWTGSVGTHRFVDPPLVPSLVSVKAKDECSQRDPAGARGTDPA